MEIDWTAEVQDTAFTVSDAISELAAMADDIDHLVIVAGLKETAKEHAGCVVVRRSMPQPYIAIGLLRDGLDSVLRRDGQDDD